MPSTIENIAQRQALAAQQTWAHRADTLITLAEHSEHAPRTSVIVVTYNNLALTRACLDSLERTRESPALEIIVVDNASSDGSAEFLTRVGCRERADTSDSTPTTVASLPQTIRV